MSIPQVSSSNIYCCKAKHDYSNDIQVLVNNLKIVPRVVIYKKALKVDQAYKSVITITNKSLYNRRLLYTTDSNDTTVRITLTDNNKTQITVLIEPCEKPRINRRRNVLISCEHTSITFAIPIIIMANDELISVPSSVIFPSTAVEHLTYYECILYNKNMKKISFTAKCYNHNLTVYTKSLKISKMDYVKILLKFNCENTQVVNDVIKLKFDTGDNFNISITHVTMKLSVYVDTLCIEYETLRFNRAETKEFRICNDSENSVVFHANFSTEDEIQLEDPDSKSNTRTLLNYQDLNALSPTKSITIPKQTTLNYIESGDKFDFRHFKVLPKCGTIPANSSITVHVNFHPIMHKDFCPTEVVPPFAVLTRLNVSFNDKIMNKIEKQILLKGSINGADIDIIPQSIDLHDVYFGEENCFQIKAVNIDGMTDAHVYFYNIDSSDTANVVVTPSEGLTLKPCESGVFHVEFYSKIETKFMVFLQFKVKNGGIFKAMIKGNSQPLRVHCFPDSLDLDVIPIAMPQHRIVLVVNPLTVPISVRCTVSDDGYETPLVLNVFDVDEPLPISVKDPVYNVLKCIQLENEEDDVDQEDNEIKIEYSTEEHEPSMLSVQSVVEENSTISSNFEHQALDLIPEMSSRLVSYFKTMKIFDKKDMEKKVVEETLNALMKIPYFENVDRYRNYAQMDWNDLAVDPKEIYCNDEIFYLNPNTGKAVSVVVIPNMVGNQHKHIALRLCPLVPPPAIDESLHLREIVDSNIMITNIHIRYRCSIPTILWDNTVTMQDQLYAGEWYDFEMNFDNQSNIGGFFYYDMIPDSHLGTIKFLNNKWKYFIEPNSEISVPCAVKFCKIGNIVLAGLIKFIGVYAGYPFHIKSEVLPPKVRFNPLSIVKTIKVLESIKQHVFIENCTPTATWFKFSLKDDSIVDLSPLGGQLGPTGQAMYTTLDIFYRDPGTYKNILYITMQFETEKVPFTIHVKGMPLFFEPDIISKDLNIGCVLCNTEEDFHEDKPNCSKVIKVINKGLRNYRILITRTKCSAKPTCTAIPSKAKIYIKPNNLVMSPLSEDYFTIFINCCTETTIYNEFRIDIIDQTDPKRIKSERLVVTATFIYPELIWNRRNVTITYHRTHKYNEHPQWDMIKLINTTENYLDSVILKTTGPFKIKELFEHIFLNELDFSMVGSETKEFFIMLDKDLIRNRVNVFYEGRLSCYANSRQQKSVNLKVKMYIPTLTIKQNNVVLFTKNVEGGTYIELMNSGQIKTIYKWKKLKEEWCYIEEEDDTNQVAEIILSDVISMLDLDPVNFEDDLEPNMTLRFQKLKCALKALDDHINVMDIINEIIDNLDLMGRRYKLVLGSEEGCLKKACKKIHEIICIHDIHAQNEENFYEQILEMEQHFDSKTIYFNRKFNLVSTPIFDDEVQQTSSGTCVFHTLDKVLGHLKLEDSFAEFEPCTDTCDLKRSLYFFEKCGILQKNQKEMCALHLPPVKKGFEVRAAFQLDIVGGKSQEFQITLVNLDKTLTLSNNNIYLGLKPWYEQFQTKVIAENITNYQLIFKINYVSTSPEKLMPKIATGYIKMLNKNIIQLPALENTLIKFEGVMGFSEEFRREVRIVINDGEKITLSLRGHGVMPMLALADSKLTLVKQKPLEVLEEYRLLQKIYYFEVFKEIIENDDDLSAPTGEEDYLIKVMSLVAETSQVSTSDSKTSSESRHFFGLLQTYVLVNTNEGLPNSKVLEQLVETEKFLNHLRFNTETASLLNMVYQNYLRVRQSYDEKIPLNLKHFTTQPLPFHLKANILEMERLSMNQFSKFIITLDFFGPGKLIASVRTAIKIPGLVIDFNIIENTDKKEFNYYHSENKFPDLNDQPYRNKKERQVDADTDPKVKHAHSYDINIRLQHERNVLIKERKWLINQYNSLNKSVYMEQKYHFTHCKMSTNSANHFSGTKVNVVILMRPQRKYYKHNQNIEDYMYIDLHMGPTLPILLHGTVVDREK